MRTVSHAVPVALAILLVFSGVHTLAQEAQPLTAELKGQQVDVSIDGVLFTSYKFSHDQKYPYFWPVIGPASGKSVTTETSEPYPHHHSLFLGCDRVNGGNYWQDVNERGQILSQGPEIVEAAGQRVVIKDECLWQQPGQDPVIRDTRTITLSAPDKATRIIDFEITLNPLVHITIEKTNHSLFSARMVPELSVASGGTLVNAEGKTAEQGTFGVESPWCDYYGARDGVTEGLAIFQHPLNRWYPSKWFTRDYGFFSPTPMFWPQGDFTALPVREPLTLAYRVVVHAGDVKAAGIADLSGAYKAAALRRGQ
ncbi:MAG TPA: PmoA family protein [Candidatus Hydrogenedentes bacterium]|nr:PmoA family protein [Candidatus Hydrogenedentota bacterium]